MDYRKIGDNYYIRMDRGDEIISNLFEISEKESIPSAIYSGIGGCAAFSEPCDVTCHSLYQ